ncbi:anthranilate synthase component I family protein [Candidatus Harpocratesius sp.]
METNIKISQIGKIKKIFPFYTFLREELNFTRSVLFESAPINSKNIHYSFIGLKPEFMIKIHNEKFSIFDVVSDQGEKIKNALETSKNSKKKHEYFEDHTPMIIPELDLLKKFFKTTPNSIPELFPTKAFSGGLAGYIGYDVMSKYVGYSKNQKINSIFPDIIMGMFTKILAFSHSSKTLYEIENNIGFNNKISEIPKIFKKFKKKSIENFERKESHLKLEQNSKLLRDFPFNKMKYSSNITKDEWTSMIYKIKEHILDGDIIQAVVSRKIFKDSHVSPLNVYEILREINPSPYMYFLDLGKIDNNNLCILGASPEALISKQQNILETVPIAGTRRRGKNANDEKKMEHELKTSTKEIAEHIMLVDLARNDLARISLPGTVKAKEYFKITKFPSIMHITSKIQSKTEYDSISVLKSVFPAGTVSGAPKKKAMQLIHKYEKENRGPYAGTVGYLNFSDDMEMAISIRTLFFHNQQYIAQAGCGIVADSNADEEYLESSNKLKYMLASIYLAENKKD